MKIIPLNTEYLDSFKDFNDYKNLERSIFH